MIEFSNSLFSLSPKSVVVIRIIELSSKYKSLSFPFNMVSKIIVLYVFTLSLCAERKIVVATVIPKPIHVVVKAAVNPPIKIEKIRGRFCDWGVLYEKLPLILNLKILKSLDT